MTSPMDDVTLGPTARPITPPLPAPPPLSFAQAVASGTQASLHAPTPGVMEKKSKSLNDSQSHRASSISLWKNSSKSFSAPTHRDDPQGSKPTTGPGLGLPAPARSYAKVAAPRATDQRPGSSARGTRPESSPLPPPIRQSFAPNNRISPVLPRTHSAFGIVVEMTGHDISSEEAVSLIQQFIPKVESIRFFKRGKSLELGFLSSEDVMRAIKTGLSYKGHLLPMYRAYQFQQDVTIITIRSLPTFSKEDTYLELERTFRDFGDISDVQFLYYPGSSIRMDSCIVHLERPPLPTRTRTPRHSQDHPNLWSSV